MYDSSPLATSFTTLLTVKSHSARHILLSCPTFSSPRPLLDSSYFVKFLLDSAIIIRLHDHDHDHLGSIRIQIRTRMDLLIIIKHSFKRWSKTVNTIHSLQDLSDENAKFHSEKLFKMWEDKRMWSSLTSKFNVYFDFSSWDRPCMNPVISQGFPLILIIQRQNQCQLVHTHCHLVDEEKIIQWLITTSITISLRILYSLYYIERNKTSSWKRRPSNQGIYKYKHNWGLHAIKKSHSIRKLLP